MPRTALVVGATGLVGGHVTELLLARPEYGQVHVLVRRPSGRSHPKLTEHVVSFDELDLGGACPDDVYACLGTTIKVAGSQEKFRRVDHDYTVNVAKLAHEAGAKRLAVVSSVGASASATSFYMKVKGETERDLRGLGYETLTIVRPSLLLGDRAEKRTGEKMAIVLMSAFAFTFVGGLRRYRPIHSRDVAKAMIQALAKGPGTTLLEWTDIRSLCDASPLLLGA